MSVNLIVESKRALLVFALQNADESVKGTAIHEGEFGFMWNS